MSGGNEIKDRLLLYREIEWQYRLSEYTDEALISIQKSLDIARNDLLNQIDRMDITLPPGREMAVLNELNDLTFGIQKQLGASITEAAEVAGEASYREYGDILSFNGKLSETVGFNFVAVSPDQLRAMVETPVGGKLLSDWIAGSFEAHIVEDIRAGLIADNLSGLSNAKMIERLRDSFGMIKRDAETLTRTYIADINNRAAEAVYKANSDIIKYEVWNSTLEVSLHGSGTCLRCSVCDGRKYKIDEPHIRPPLHPRCVTADSIIFAPDMTHLMESKYSGPIIKATLSDGTSLPVTPSHMLMTPNGLVMARFLTDSDYLLSCTDFKGVIFGDPNDNRNNLRIDNVIKSFSESTGMTTSCVPVSPENFHGDGVFGDENINVIFAESFLVNNINTKFLEHFAGNALSSIDTASLLSSYSLITKFFKRFLDSTHRSVGVSREFFSFANWCLRHSQKHGIAFAPGGDVILFEKFDNWRSACSDFFGYFFDRDFIVKEFDNFFSVQIEIGMVYRLPNFKASLDKSIFDCISFGNSHQWGNLCEMSSGHIEPVKIVDIKFVHVDSLPVYDVSTLSSSYIVNGILSSNCRCFMTPETISYRELGLDIDEMQDSLRPYTIRGDKKSIIQAGQFEGDFKEFLDSRGFKYQNDLLGPNRMRLLKEGTVKFEDLVDKDGNVRLLLKGKDGSYVGLQGAKAVASTPKIVYTKSIDEARTAMSTATFSDVQKKAVFDYTAEQFNIINGKLRGFRSKITDTAQETVNGLDSFFKVAPRVEAQSFRGVTLDQSKFTDWAKYKKGDTYQDMGFMSTTTDRNVMNEFLGNEQYQVEMNIKGKNGVLIDSLSDAKREKEILFERGNKFLIEKIKVKKSKFAGKIIMDIMEI